MPINKSFKPMLESMKKKYTEGATKCYDMSDGTKFCMNDKAWSVFYAMMRKKGKDETKSLSEDNFEISDIEDIQTAIEILSEEAEGKDFSYGIQVQKLSDSTIIRGVLLAEGIWKGIKYKYEEFKNSASKFLSGESVDINGSTYTPRAGDVDHKKTLKYGDRTIGELTKVVPNDMLRCLMFEAKITDEEAKKDIADGLLDSVSPTGKFEELDELTSAVPVGKNYKPLGWALTGTPACKYSTIFNYDLSLLDETSSQPLNDNKHTINSNEGENISMSQTNEDNNPPASTQTPPVKKETPVATVTPTVTSTPVQSVQAEVSTVTPPAPVVDEAKIISQAVEKAKTEAKAEAKAEMEEQLKVKMEEIKALIPKPEKPKEPELVGNILQTADVAAAMLLNEDLKPFYKKKEGGT